MVVVWENSRGPRITKCNQSMASKSFNKSFKKWVRFKNLHIYEGLVIVNLKLIITKILGSLNRKKQKTKEAVSQLSHLMTVLLFSILFCF